MLLIGTGEEKQIKDTPWTFEIFLGCMDLLVSSRVCWLKGCLFYRFNIYIYVYFLHFLPLYVLFYISTFSTCTFVWLRKAYCGYNKFFIFLYIVGCSISL